MGGEKRKTAGIVFYREKFFENKEKGTSNIKSPSENILET